MTVAFRRPRAGDHVRPATARRASTVAGRVRCREPGRHGSDGRRRSDRTVSEPGRHRHAAAHRTRHGGPAAPSTGVARTPARRTWAPAGRVSSIISAEAREARGAWRRTGARRTANTGRRGSPRALCRSNVSGVPSSRRTPGRPDCHRPDSQPVADHAHRFRPGGAPVGREQSELCGRELLDVPIDLGGHGGGRYRRPVTPPPVPTATRPLCDSSAWGPVAHQSREGERVEGGRGHGMNVTPRA